MDTNELIKIATGMQARARIIEENMDSEILRKAGGNQVSTPARAAVKRLLPKYRDAIVAQTIANMILERSRFDTEQDYLDWFLQAARDAEARL